MATTDWHSELSNLDGYGRLAFRIVKNWDGSGRLAFRTVKNWDGYTSHPDLMSFMVCDPYFNHHSVFKLQFVIRALSLIELNIGTVTFKITNMCVIFWLMFDHKGSKQNGGQWMKFGKLVNKII